MVRYLPHPCCVPEQPTFYPPKSIGKTLEVVAEKVLIGTLTIFINCYLGKSAKFPSNQGITGCFI